MIKRRNRAKQILSLEDRLAADSKLSRDKAATLPPCSEREALVARAKRNDAAAAIRASLRQVVP